MSKTRVENFDREVCEGCPFREAVDADTGRPIIDRAASVEGAIIGEDYKCGLCSCPLKNLEITNVAPDNCPRLDQHNSE